MSTYVCTDAQVCGSVDIYVHMSEGQRLSSCDLPQEQPTMIHETETLYSTLH